MLNQKIIKNKIREDKNVFQGTKHNRERIYKMNKAIEKKKGILAWAFLVQLDVPGPDQSLSCQTRIGLGSK